MSENLHVTPEQFIPDLDTAAVWTVRYIDPSGFECQLSLEGSSGSEVLKKAQGAVEYLKETQCAPIHRINPTSTVKEEEDDESICVKHQCAMRLYHKNNRSWYAHRTKDGQWCNGG